MATGIREKPRSKVHGRCSWTSCATFASEGRCTYGRSHDGEGFLLAALVRRLQNLHVQHLEGEIKDEVAMIDKRQTLVTPGGH